MAPSSPTGTLNREAEPADRNRRRHERFACSWPAVCRFGGQTCDATVIDASAGGLGLESMTLNIAQGETIYVELGDAGGFSCRVAWRRGTRCGVEFLLDDMSPGEAEMQELAAVLSKS